MEDHRNKHKEYGSFKPLFRLTLESVVDIWVIEIPQKCQAKWGSGYNQIHQINVFN